MLAVEVALSIQCDWLKAMLSDVLPMLCCHSHACVCSLWCLTCYTFLLNRTGVELGFNYPWPIITPEAAKEGVAWASAVVERCATNSSGNSGSSSGTGFQSLMPCKEPYRWAGCGAAGGLLVGLLCVIGVLA